MPEMTKDAYYTEFGPRITQASERLFIDEFLWPLLDTKIGYIIPQRPFIDSTGSSPFGIISCKSKPLSKAVNND